MYLEYYTENSLMNDPLSYYLYFSKCLGEISIFLSTCLLYKLKELFSNFFNQKYFKASYFQNEKFRFIMPSSLCQPSLLLNYCFEVLKMIKNKLFMHFLNIVSLFSMMTTINLSFFHFWTFQIFISFEVLVYHYNFIINFSSQFHNFY